MLQIIQQSVSCRPVEPDGVGMSLEHLPGIKQLREGANYHNHSTPSGVQNTGRPPVELKIYALPRTLWWVDQNLQISSVVDGYFPCTPDHRDRLQNQLQVR